VARAWADPEFKRRLLADATEAVNSLAGFDPVAAHLIAVENTPQPTCRRLHLVLLLPLVGAGTAVRLVQVGAVSLAHGDRPQGGPCRVRRGKPLLSHAVIVQLIAATTTKAGLAVHCGLDDNN
jgi:hypothetical protein